LQTNLRFNAQQLLILKLWLKLSPVLLLSKSTARFVDLIFLNGGFEAPHLKAHSTTLFLII
jgi:hypothetical protein